MPRTLPLLILLASSPALADDVVDAPEVEPSFPHLAPGGPRFELGGDLALTFPTGEDTDGYLVTAHTTMQAVSPANGMGGYVSYSLVSLNVDGDFDTQFGNLDLGLLYHVTGTADADATFRAGLVVPTMSHEDLFDGFTYAIGTMVTDPSDLVTALPGVTSLRLAASPTYHRDRVYLRADLGVDLPFADDDEYAEVPSPMLHADLGIGFTPRPVGGSVELQNMCLTRSDQEDRCLHLVAADLQVATGRSSVVTVGLSRPFGLDVIDDFFSLEVGFRARR